VCDVGAAMSLMEMEGTEVMEDKGNSGGSFAVWELRVVLTFWNIGLTSLLYLSNLVSIF
jgi:hypothetical protein